MKFVSSGDVMLLDALFQAAPNSSKTTVRSWLKKGRIYVDGQVVKAGNTLVNKGQTIEIKSRPHYFKKGVKILYEDQYLVAIEKPEGLLSVATAFQKDQTAHAFLKTRFRPKRIYVVHRLDQDTSGVILFALNKHALENLKAAFEKHEIERRYVAIVEGHLATQTGTWISYLYEDENYYVHSTKNKRKGQLAITHYKVCGISKKHTLLDLRLETGKKNQIRVHCQDAGHPVAGDQKYGAHSNPIKRLCLHAYYLSFKHPITQKIMRFESKVPVSFFRIVQPKRE